MFFTDRSVWSIIAAEILSQIAARVLVVRYEYGDPLPAIPDWSGDTILAFKADLIIPDTVLRRATLALNFHPGPPSYRGIGGYGWALANGEAQYGVTCHHMTREVDAGPIVAVDRFPILPCDTPSSLNQRTASYLLVLFQRIVCSLVLAETLPLDEVSKWSTRLYRRTESPQDIMVRDF